MFKKPFAGPFEPSTGKPPVNLDMIVRRYFREKIGGWLMIYCSMSAELGEGQEASNMSTSTLPTTT